MIISGICPKHGYWKGPECKKCANGHRPNESFYTTKDQLYYFLDTQTFSQPKQIHGKGHWKQELKKAGLTDDFKQGRRFKDASEVKHPKQQFDKRDWEKTMDTAFREKHKWMSKEKFWRANGKNR